MNWACEFPQHISALNGRYNCNPEMPEHIVIYVKLPDEHIDCVCEILVLFFIEIVSLKLNKCSLLPGMIHNLGHVICPVSF